MWFVLVQRSSGNRVVVDTCWQPISEANHWAWNKIYLFCWNQSVGFCQLGSSIGESYLYGFRFLEAIQTWRRLIAEALIMGSCLQFYQSINQYWSFCFTLLLAKSVLNDESFDECQNTTVENRSLLAISLSWWFRYIFLCPILWCYQRRWTPWIAKGLSNTQK